MGTPRVMSPSPELDPVPTQEQTVLGGRYALGPLLGRGGAADVHRATDLVLDREVAVKLLRESAEDPSERARFVTEAKTLARLTHPGLVGLIDAGLEDERPYFVMELVTGGTLRDLCRGPRVDRGWAARIGAQIADALAVVHAAGVVHRDVKPGNVLLDGDRIRLADFGIARLLSEPAGHTRTGMAVGTAAYLAPEQVTGAPVTTAADVYSLGLVLLELLSGERAYDGTPVEAAVARLHQPPVLPTDLSAGWQSLLTAMTALEADDRPTAAEAALRLRVIVDAYAAAQRGVQTAAMELSALSGRVADRGAVPDPPDAGTTQARATVPPPRAADAVTRRPHRVLAAAHRRVHRSPAGATFVGVVLLVCLGALGVTVIGAASEEPAAATTSQDAGTGADSPSDIPDGVPAELRAPLADLHRAVRG